MGPIWHACITICPAKHRKVYNSFINVLIGENGPHLGHFSDRSHNWHVGPLPSYWLFIKIPLLPNFSFLKTPLPRMGFLKTIEIQYPRTIFSNMKFYFWNCSYSGLHWLPAHLLCTRLTAFWVLPTTTAVLPEQPIPSPPTSRPNKFPNPSSARPRRPLSKCTTNLVIISHRRRRRVWKYRNGWTSLWRPPWTWKRESRICVASAARHTPDPAPWKPTSGPIPAKNRTGAKTATNPSAKRLIWRLTFGPIPARNRSGARFAAVVSRNPLRWPRTWGPTPAKGLTVVVCARRHFRIPQRSRNICEYIRERSPTSANYVSCVFRNPEIWIGIWGSTVPWVRAFCTLDDRGIRRVGQDRIWGGLLPGY